MTGFSLDVSELTRFGDDLRQAGDAMLGKTKPVVAKGALNVKNSMRNQMSQSEHFGQVARSITYDIVTGNGWIEARIGPVTSGRTVGDLAHLAYFGGAHGGGGTVRDPQTDLDEEQPKFEKSLTDLIASII